MKINYDELQDLVNIARRCDGTSDKLIDELSELKNQSRFQRYSDYRYDVAKVITKNYPGDSDLYQDNECYINLTGYLQKH